MTIRYGLPKYHRTWSGLSVLGLGVIWLSSHVGAAAVGWISSLGLLIIAAAMSALVAGMIAERREWERLQRNGGANHGHSGSNTY